MGAVIRSALLLGLSLSIVACSSGSDAETKPTPEDAGSIEADRPVPTTGFQITVSGEDYARTGFPFTAGSSLANGEPPAFVEGWEVRFEHVLVTLANIRLNADPDLSSTAPEKIGPVVAEDTSAYAVDLVLGGDIPGKSGLPEEKTVAITSFSNETGTFDPAKRYAFSFDTVAASSAAKLVNLDEVGKKLYADATGKGYAMLYVGTATYKGPKPEPGTVFAKMPTTVKFNLGFANPTSFINCKNTDYAKVKGTYPRGVQPVADTVVTVQITMHTDHAFWNQLNTDGTPLFFDAIAANAVGFGTSTEGSVTIDDLADVDITAVRTRTGEPLPSRSAVSDYAAFPGQVAMDPNGTTFAKKSSFARYLSYAAASAGHLNVFGNCKLQYHFTP